MALCHGWLWQKALPKVVVAATAENGSVLLLSLRAVAGCSCWFPLVGCQLLYNNSLQLICSLLILCYWNRGKEMQNILKIVPTNPAYHNVKFKTRPLEFRGWYPLFAAWSLYWQLIMMTILYAVLISLWLISSSFLSFKCSIVLDYFSSSSMEGLKKKNWNYCPITMGKITKIWAWRQHCYYLHLMLQIWILYLLSKLFKGCIIWNYFGND